MAIPNPNPNIADGIKSDNKTYSSNKIESLIQTATELPIPGAGDAGKVLTVNSDHDGYELDTPVAPTSIIDDSASSESTVYSSDKVDALLSDKQNIITSVSASVVPEANAYVSPFSYYAENDFSTDIGTKTVIGIVLDGGTSTDVLAYNFVNNKVRLFATKADSVTIRLYLI